MNKDAMATYLIGELMKENVQLHDLEIPESTEEKEQLLHALFNKRPPMAASSQFMTIQDLYLQVKKAERGIVHMDDLTPTKADNRLYLWQGDITRLEVDAIVNAANRQLLGCFQPLHNCIDNTIHTNAGIQLRQTCHDIMAKQGYDEPVGTAKITPAYNLPSGFVIHTVGPNITGEPNQIEEDLLMSSYLSSLALAEKNGLEVVAFPCISTGVFHFPQEKAAQIATSTVKNFLKNAKTVKKVIFNVFTDKDFKIYQELLGD
ncbi:protein-ADP-ribose hydrolase [Streptococcus dentiloxodontae]